MSCSLLYNPLCISSKFSYDIFVRDSRLVDDCEDNEEKDDFYKFY